MKSNSKIKPIIKEAVSFFDLQDVKTGTDIIGLLFSDSSNIEKLLRNPNFDDVLGQLIDQYFLGNELEWVIVIPLSKYKKSCQGEYQLIFGSGQKFSEESLFVYWAPKENKISFLEFKYNKEKADVISPMELYWLSTKYDLPDHPNEYVIWASSVEHIKERIIKLKEVANRKSMFKVARKSDFLLRPEHLQSNFNNLNLVLHLIKGASLILLRDAFDIRYVCLQKKKTNLDYDPYSVTRSFLRAINKFPVRQIGASSRLRMGKTDWELFEDFIKSDKRTSSNIFEKEVKWNRKGSIHKYICDTLSLVKNKCITTLSQNTLDKAQSILKKHR